MVKRRGKKRHRMASQSTRRKIRQMKKDIRDMVMDNDDFGFLDEYIRRDGGLTAPPIVTNGEVEGRGRWFL